MLHVTLSSSNSVARCLCLLGAQISNQENKHLAREELPLVRCLFNQFPGVYMQPKACSNGIVCELRSVSDEGRRAGFSTDNECQWINRRVGKCVNRIGQRSRVKRRFARTIPRELVNVNCKPTRRSITILPRAQELAHARRNGT